ncbi:MAG TPA: aldose epimerase family protein [Pyrinomonadaceae bacterium]|nr:aldose epimerase family protein [Pyrinomonadaceae bacterium]
MTRFRISNLFFALLLVLSCVLVAHAQASVTKASFGKTADGENVDLYTLRNTKGVEAKITNLGGILVSLKVPDKNGKFDDVVLGFNDLDSYLKPHPYFGALIGRYGNRIAKGRFTLDGVEYKLAVNNGENTLHGGIKGFDKVIWTGRESKTTAGPAVTLTYLSKDGEEGYPGNLNVTVVYTLTNNNELKIDYSATTDKDTVINLTHHSYFNLAGEGNGDILNHRVMINGTRFLPTDAGSIPTGELRNVSGTPFDFRKMFAIGARINQDEEQLKLGNGYDHTWIINGRPGTLRLAAQAFEPTSGRRMQVWTTEPGMQFYTGNFLDGTLTGKSGKIYQRRYGFCFETQHYPDSPNHPAFPTTTLKKGATYRSTTIYRFSR